MAKADTITEPVEATGEIAEAIASAISETITVRKEDWGIGSYEYAGARGIDNFVVLLVNESLVLVDMTRLWPNIEELPDVKGQTTKDGEIVDFAADYTGTLTMRGDKVLAEYEMSQT